VPDKVFGLQVGGAAYGDRVTRDGLEFDGRSSPHAVGRERRRLSS
jgi:hypothetical protein